MIDAQRELASPRNSIAKIDAQVFEPRAARLTPGRTVWPSSNRPLRDPNCAMVVNVLRDAAIAVIKQNVPVRGSPCAPPSNYGSMDACTAVVGGK
ncbi:hypothetical protein [Paraburkholderia sp. EG304]|uniref:hypothetical protein n=1 Tax=Paraburkholderia sp. EG304 TaxID=3237015 RepID=UPI003979B634